MALLAALLLLAATTAMGFNNPVSVPALKSDLVLRSPLLATVSIGARVVGVGQRGHIVVSENAGKSWTQGNVPLSSDLVAVSFPSPLKGWAVGHDGVVIHTEDGGRNWQKQFDGHAAFDIALKYYDGRAKAGDTEAAAFLEKEKNLMAYGGTQPLMDVYFESDLVGYIVGTFNRIFRTGDGGKTWTPIMDKIDNGGELHLYSIHGGFDAIYVTGEQGKVWCLDATTHRFALRAAPYDGTLFGTLFGADGAVLAFGMRGAAFRSADQGSSWTRIKIAGQAGIAAGARLANGDLLLATLAGEALLSKDGGKTFQPVKMNKPMPYFGVTALSGNALAFVGTEGVRVEAINLNGNSTMTMQGTMGANSLENKHGGN